MAYSIPKLSSFVCGVASHYGPVTPSQKHFSGYHFVSDLSPNSSHNTAVLSYYCLQIGFFSGLRIYLRSSEFGAFKMSSRLILSIVFGLLLIIQCNTVAKSAEEPSSIISTAYDELQRKGFPSGLLPNSVANYSLDTSTGKFSVQLRRRCDITLPPDNYPASFSEKITGTLTEGYIQGLTGIDVRVFFKWWSITGIRSSGKNLVFEVGVASAKYPSSNFDESPDCEGSNHLAF